MSGLCVSITSSEAVGGFRPNLLGGKKRGLVFGGLDLIFKDTISIIDQKSLSASYLLNLMIDSAQAACIIVLGHNEVLFRIL